MPRLADECPDCGGKRYQYPPNVGRWWCLECRTRYYGRTNVFAEVGRRLADAGLIQKDVEPEGLDDFLRGIMGTMATPSPSAVSTKKLRARLPRWKGTLRALGDEAVAKWKRGEIKADTPQQAIRKLCSLHLDKNGKRIKAKSVIDNLGIRRKAEGKP